MAPRLLQLDLCNLYEIDTGCLDMPPMRNAATEKPKEQREREREGASTWGGGCGCILVWGDVTPVPGGFLHNMVWFKINIFVGFFHL